VLIGFLSPSWLILSGDFELKRPPVMQGQVRSNRETKKPKKEKPKIAAVAPSLAKIATPPKKK
jgi:hypothetical protein